MFLDGAGGVTLAPPSAPPAELPLLFFRFFFRHSSRQFMAASPFFTTITHTLLFSLSLFSCCCQSGIYSRFPQWKCRQTNLGDACHPCLSSDLRLKLKKVKMTLMLLFQSRMRIGRRRRRRRFHYIGADAIQEVRQ